MQVLCVCQCCVYVTVVCKCSVCVSVVCMRVHACGAGRGVFVQASVSKRMSVSEGLPVCVSESVSALT